jgi:hypothetical protein
MGKVLATITLVLAMLSTACAESMRAGVSTAITVGEFNLSTSKFAGGVVPGIGYGITVWPNKWHAVGLAAYLSFIVGKGQPNQAAPTLMLSFASYVRLGLGAIVQEQEAGPARTQWRLLFGLGADFGK